MPSDSKTAEVPSHDEFAPDGPDPAPATRRAIRYRMLCLLWISPSLGALGILANDARQWLRPASANATGPTGPGAESWLALGLVAAHIAFAVLARRSRAHLPGHSTTLAPTSTSPPTRD